MSRHPLKTRLRRLLNRLPTPVQSLVRLVLRLAVPSSWLGEEQSAESEEHSANSGTTSYCFERYTPSRSILTKISPTRVRTHSAHVLDKASLPWRINAQPRRSTNLRVRVEKLLGHVFVKFCVAGTAHAAGRLPPMTDSVLASAGMKIRNTIDNYVASPETSARTHADTDPRGEPSERSRPGGRNLPPALSSFF